MAVKNETVKVNKDKVFNQCRLTTRIMTMSMMVSIAVVPTTMAVVLITMMMVVLMPVLMMMVVLTMSGGGDDNGHRTLTFYFIDEVASRFKKIF